MATSGGAARSRATASQRVGTAGASNASCRHGAGLGHHIALHMRTSISPLSALAWEDGGLCQRTGMRVRLLTVVGFADCGTAAFSPVMELGRLMPMPFRPDST